MHDLLIVASYLAMILCPCIVATRCASTESAA